MRIQTHSPSFNTWTRFIAAWTNIVLYSHIGTGIFTTLTFNPEKLSGAALQCLSVSHLDLDFDVKRSGTTESLWRNGHTVCLYLYLPTLVSVTNPSYQDVMLIRRGFRSISEPTNSLCHWPKIGVASSTIRRGGGRKIVYFQNFFLSPYFANLQTITLR